MVFGKKQHKPTGENKTRVMGLGNGQLLATIPKSVAAWKNIGKGSLIKWSDGGPGRIIVEIVNEEK
jgi:hypothetical protein